MLANKPGQRIASLEPYVIPEDGVAPFFLFALEKMSEHTDENGAPIHHLRMREYVRLDILPLGVFNAVKDSTKAYFEELERRIHKPESEDT